ncbi:YeeE/YedE family protein [Pseudogemmobacter sp. W21_MBD1_M6]|uniref:YeeE/YedE family protein n=1 Tax=Pseudogemmobacter sp. W21_MBD1_M6 TaxID=3240271 RepID=UPI003F95BA24
MENLPIGMLAAAVGLGGGITLGLAARLGSFCTLGAIESAGFGGDQTRLRMWGIVLGVAIFATHLLAATGHVDIGATIYHQVKWNPLASVAGGLIFGYGMAMAGNCGFGALARFGGGDLRALVVVVVIAVFGFVTLNGPLAPLRVALFPQVASDGPQSYASVIGGLTGLPALGVAGAISAALIVWALTYAPLRASGVQIFWAAMAGLAIVSGLWGTAWLAAESLGQIPVEGHTFTAPLGRTLIYMMTSTSGGLSFSVGSVAGVLIGAFAGSTIKGLFRWEACEDPRELGRQVMGAALMGIGGVIAMGCSVGQGATAFATLAYSAPVTLAAICGGAMIGLTQLIRGFQPE